VIKYLPVDAVDFQGTEVQDERWPSDGRASFLDDVWFSAWHKQRQFTVKIIPILTPLQNNISLTVALAEIAPRGGGTWRTGAHEPPFHKYPFCLRMHTIRHIEITNNPKFRTALDSTAFKASFRTRPVSPHFETAHTSSDPRYYIFIFIIFIFAKSVDHYNCLPHCSMV